MSLPSMLATNHPRPSLAWGLSPLTGAEIAQLVSNPAGFDECDFPLQDDLDLCSCDLQNENLFPSTRVTNLPDCAAYALLEPAFLLASRILLECWSTFPGVAAGGREEALATVRRYLPAVKLDTLEQPLEVRYNHEADCVCINHELLCILTHPTMQQSQRLAALVLIAIQLCGKVLTVAAYRSQPHNPWRLDDWESTLHGGTITPLCPANHLPHIRGLALNRSGAEAMKLSISHQRRLLTETHWGGAPEKPLWPPLDKRVRMPVFQNDTWWLGSDGKPVRGLIDYRVWARGNVCVGGDGGKSFTAAEWKIVAWSLAVGEEEPESEDWGFDRDIWDSSDDGSSEESREDIEAREVVRAGDGKKVGRGGKRGFLGVLRRVSALQTKRGQKEKETAGLTSGQRSYGCF